MWWIRRKIWQIKNLIKWFSIIWNQYDWDYMYAIAVFKFQLSKIANELDSQKARTVSAEYNAQRIRTVIKLMDKVYNEEYGTEYLDKLDNMFGEGTTDFKFVPSEKEGCSELLWGYEGKPNEKEIEDMRTILFKESQEKQKRAHKLLWKIIEKDIQRWWN